MELSLVQCKNCKHLEKITNEYLCPFDWCENVLDSPDRDLQRRCKHYQAATNADRIRAMSDEELAKKISGIESFALTCGGGWPPEKWLDWLKSEAK